MPEVNAKIPLAASAQKANSRLPDIKEIRRYLSNNMSPQGIESLRPIVLTAVEDGGSVKETIEPPLSALDRVKSEMAQGQ